MDALGTLTGFLLPLITCIFGQTTLQVVWMVPFTSHPTSNFVYNASTSVAALALGVQTVYNASILPNHLFNITAIDTNCSSKQSIGALVDLMSRLSIDVVLGPPCAQVVQPIGELLAYKDIPLFNWVSLGQSLNYKEGLNTYIRTMAPLSSLGGIMTLFYYYTGWRRLIMISCEGDDYEGGAETIETNIKYQTAAGFLVSHHYSDVSINASIADIDQILSNIIHEGRIIILVIPRDELRTYMLRAYFLGMTGGDYQFLYADTQLAGSEDVMILNSDLLWKAGDQYDAIARQAFENVLYFVLGHTSRDIWEWSDDADRAYTTTFNGRADLPTPTHLDEFSAYLHDTIILYALTLNNSLTYGTNGSGSYVYLWSSIEFFKGLSGDVVMNQLGDRQPAFFVYDMNTSGSFHQVAHLLYIIDDNGTTVTTSSSFTQIIWGDGRTTDDPYIPPDTPPCGFFNEKCPPGISTGTDYVLIICVCAAMLVVLLALFLIFRLWRNEKNLLNMSWKIKYSNLNFNFCSKKVHSSMQSSKRLTGSTGSVESTTYSGTIRSGSMSAQTSRHSTARGQIFTTVAMYKGDIVAVKLSSKKKIQSDRKFLLQMKHLSELKHANVTTFVGVSTGPENSCSVWEYCNKGSIQDVIENDDIRLDTMFKLSLAVDICQGLQYIHKSSVRYHGNLRSSNCVIDSRWVCKLTDFGIQRLRPAPDSEENIGEHAFYARLFWTAPEMLRKILKTEQFQYSCEADIYGLGVIVKELLCRNEAYGAECHLTPKEIILKVANPGDPENLFRPAILETELDCEHRRTNLEYLIQRCWAENPDNRPSMKGVLRTLNKINPYKKASVVDNMIAMMEKYTNNLEEIVAERTEQLQEEKVKTDALLYRMLPRKVAESLKVGLAVQAETFDSVTIYFSDIVQFTDLASESTPMQIVALLNALYTLFDDIISHYDVYKVETIGDAYMIVSGLPEKNGNLHVREIGGVALSILQSVITFKVPHKPNRKLEIRIGLHTGSVVAGVVGLTMPRFCLFGDTVNTASRMESNGKHMNRSCFAALKIHISPHTKSALESFPEFVVEDRGEIPIKGKGMMRTYWLSRLYNAEMEDGLEASQYEKHTNLDKMLEGDQLYTYAGQSVGMKVDANVEGKISVADSGIYMDKCMEDKCVNTNLNNATSSGDNIDTNDCETVTHDKTKHTKRCSDTTGNILYNTYQAEDVAKGKGASELFELSRFFCEAFNRDQSILENSETDTKSDTDTDEYKCTGEAFEEETKHLHGPVRDMFDINIDRHGKESNTVIMNDTYNNIKGQVTPGGGVGYVACLGETNNRSTEDSARNYTIEEDIRLDKRKNTEARFKAPARRSATDFMAVHNNWFDNEQC